MTVHEMARLLGLEEIQLEEDRAYTGVYCCDLLSLAMASAPQGSVWVTVLGNRNVIAVATLAEVSAVVLAQGGSFDEQALQAAQGKVTLLRSQEPVYETAVKIGALLR